jgi:hypothetical protein
VTVYTVNKLLRQSMLRDYPDGSGERFLAGVTEAARVGTVNEEEFLALKEGDFVCLYRLGAHPFLIWSWASRMNKTVSRNIFRDHYAAQVAPYGRPDFAC